MGRWHNHYVDGMAHFCRASVSKRQPVLNHAGAQVLYKEWERGRTALSVSVLAYVIMPDHVHMLVWSEQGKRIQDFLQRTLSRTSKKLGDGGKFWKERARVVPVYSDKVMRIKLDYIHNNPVKECLAVTADEWPHSGFAQIELGRSDGAVRV